MYKVCITLCFALLVAWINSFAMPLSFDRQVKEHATHHSESRSLHCDELPTSKADLSQKHTLNESACHCCVGLAIVSSSPVFTFDVFTDGVGYERPVWAQDPILEEIFKPPK